MFNQDNRGQGSNFRRSGKRDFGGNRGGGFGGRNAGRSGGMHSATCAECGDECQVPFKPTGEKPVYCSNCFEKQGGSSRSNSRDRERPRFSDRSDRSDRPMYDAICSACGADCQVPFKPTEGKDIFCDACFGKNSPTKTKDHSKNTESYKDQFATLNSKLDQILTLLVPKPIETKKAETAKKEVKVENKPEAKMADKKAGKKTDAKTAKSVKAVKTDKKKKVAKK